MRDASGLDPATLARLYVEHAPDLLRFLRGVLRDEQAALDVLHTAFARAAEMGGNVNEAALRSWLFQVAYREALALRRRSATQQRALERRREAASGDSPLNPEQLLVRRETVERVRAAIAALPEAQRAVVIARVYRGKKFAEIAAELGVPLGTVLTRMRAAVRRLRAALRDEQPGAQE